MNILMNKKGVIGTTLSWIVATLIIVFILLLFIAMVFLLSDWFVSSISSAGVSNSPGIVLDQTNNLISFVQDKEVKNLISGWADDGFILSFDDFLNGKSDEKIDNICNEIKKYSSAFKLDVNELYFKAGDESFIAEINENELVCRLVSPNQVVIAFDQQSKINSQVFIFSDNGNKVKIIHLKK